MRQEIKYIVKNKKGFSIADLKKRDFENESGLFFFIGKDNKKYLIDLTLKSSMFKNKYQYFIFLENVQPHIISKSGNTISDIKKSMGNDLMKLGLKMEENFLLKAKTTFLEDKSKRFNENSLLKIEKIEQRKKERRIAKTIKMLDENFLSNTNSEQMFTINLVTSAINKQIDKAKNLKELMEIRKEIDIVIDIISNKTDLKDISSIISDSTKLMNSNYKYKLEELNKKNR